MPENHEKMWEDYLTDLELDYTYAAARHLPPSGSTWKSPEELGAVPEKFVERAARLQKLQRELIEQLAAERQEVGKQLTALRQVPRKPNPTPVYLDITG